MKYRTLAVIVMLLTLFTFTASAANYEYHISPGEGFTSAQYGDDLTQISQKLNMSVDDLNTYFNKNGILYLAVSDDTKTQIKISTFTDNYSSTVSDIAYLDDAGMTEFINAISDDPDNPASVINNNGRKYICVKHTLQDSGGTYTVTQYITICNNKTFYFAGYNPGEDTSDDVDAMFKSFKLQHPTTNTQKALEQKSKFNRQYFIVNCGIVLFGVAAIISVIGIIKEKFKTTKEPQKNED